MKRWVVFGLLLISLVLLVPGLVAPVFTIRGVLTREGIAEVAPLLLERGLNDQTMGVLTSMVNPAILGFLQATGSDLRTMIVEKLTPEITASLQASGEGIPVYEQTRSILGSVRQLYDAGSPFPATLVLLFSVIVPAAKAGLVAWSMFMGSAARHRTMRAVAVIAKWSMADVFVVALFVTYLAAQATQAPDGDTAAAPSLIAFTAHFGPGFYWFTAYCLFSLASHQVSMRIASRMPDAVPGEDPSRAWRAEADPLQGEALREEPLGEEPLRGEPLWPEPPSEADRPAHHVGPETPAPETPASGRPAPETPAPGRPARETPALELPAPEAPARGTSPRE